MLVVCVCGSWRICDVPRFLRRGAVIPAQVRSIYTIISTKTRFRPPSELRVEPGAGAPRLGQPVRCSGWLLHSRRSKSETKTRKHNQQVSSESEVDKARGLTPQVVAQRPTVGGESKDVC